MVIAQVLAQGVQFARDRFHLLRPGRLQQGGLIPQVLRAFAPLVKIFRRGIFQGGLIRALAIAISGLDSWRERFPPFAAHIQSLQFPIHPSQYPLDGSRRFLFPEALHLLLRATTQFRAHMAQSSRRELALEMRRQVPQRLCLDVGIPRRSKITGGFAQQSAKAPKLLLCDPRARQAQHRAHSLDIFARAVNRFSVPAIVQTFLRVLDSFPGQTSDPFSDRLFSFETKRHRYLLLLRGNFWRSASTSLLYCWLPVISRPSQSGG